MKRWLVAILSMISVQFFAQTISSYRCDFENEAENAEWKLNTPKNENITWKNLWVIGTAVNNGGEKGLYVSADAGATASYAPTDQIMIAWRELTLATGNYDIVMDWRSMGTAATYMKVCWVPESYFNDFICGNNATITGRKWITDNELIFQSVDTIYGSSVWQQSMSSLVSDGTPHRLLFVWRSSSTAALLPPGACVDNIEIARNNCGRPSSLEVNMQGAMATFSWQSSAENFAVRYSKIGENETFQKNDVQGSSLTVPLSNGVYNVTLQVRCEGDTSVWYAFPPVIVYDADCFNYLDLSDENCSYSDSTASDYMQNKFKPGKLDYGYAASYSYHTIHYMPGEYDVRTYNSKDAEGNVVEPLYTIPSGEVASVRINGWRGRPASVAGKSEENARVSRVTYDYVVDKEEASNLILKYAVVLQVPSHDEPQQPRFTLDIVDATTGASLSGCTTVDFAATLINAKKEGWYFSSYDDGDSKVIWKDWTTIGLNLADYDGKHIQVVLTAYGCTASVHYGYAYFTLNCIKGGIEGIQCGNNPTEQFIAPEGFKYHWYKESAPKEKLPNQDQRIFPVAYDDTTHYAVECIYPTDDACSFVLRACATPRFPIPEFNCELLQKDCKNIVKLHNTSHIRTKIIKENRYVDTEERPDYVLWELGELGGQTYEWEPEIEVPATGGTYTLSLQAKVGLCDSTQVYVLKVPALTDTTVTETVQRCAGDFYVYQNRMIVSDTTILTYGKTWAGCDSTHRLQIRFVDKIEVMMDTTLAEGDTLILGEQRLTATGTYTATFVSAMGCDSVVNVNLTVVPRLRVKTDSVVNVCADEPAIAIPYTVLSGVATECKVTFATNALSAGLRDTVILLSAQEGDLLIDLPHNIPGWYALQLQFFSKENGTLQTAMEVQVKYASLILSQRFNDIIGIKKEIATSEFAAYRWYKQGKVIEGAENAYLYLPQGLGDGVEYSVELFTADAERGVESCAIVSHTWQENEIEVAPTLLQQGMPLRIKTKNKGTARLIAVDGRLVAQYSLAAAENSLNLRLAAGLYFLTVDTEEGARETMMIQIKN